MTSSGSWAHKRFCSAQNHFDLLFAPSAQPHSILLIFKIFRIAHIQPQSRLKPILRIKQSFKFSPFRCCPYLACPLLYREFTNLKCQTTLYFQVTHLHNDWNHIDWSISLHCVHKFFSIVFFVKQKKKEKLWSLAQINTNCKPPIVDDSRFPGSLE